MVRRTLAIALMIGTATSLTAREPASPMPTSADAADMTAYPFRDPGLAPDVRARDVVSRMTLEEKAAQLFDIAPPVARLGVPGYNYWNEALHGVARAGVATVFPQAIGMAATWNTQLIHAQGDTVATEFRAKYLDTVQPDGSTERYRGLTVWSPNINIFRDPRWGRGQETYGEDPYLTGRMGVAYIEGLQGEDPMQLKVSATAKHFAVHSGPELSRHKDDIHPNAHDLEDTYLPAFRAAVTEANVESVMCAYNAVDGLPACANRDLLVDTLRGRWGFDGHVTSDCWAINDFFEQEGHAYLPTAEASVTAAFKAGMDTICGDFKRNGITSPDAIVNAVKDGMMAEAVIDVALARLFETRVKLGLFDPADTGPYSAITSRDFDTPDHRALARDVGGQSMVLLKNDGLLPLQGSPRRIAVIGPNADNEDALVGNYNGTPSNPVTVLAGIKARWPQAEVRYAEGVGLTGPTMPAIDAGALCIDAACAQRGLTAASFTSHMGEGTATETRIDTTPNIVWGGSERDGSTRWTGYVTAPVTGTYRFGWTGDDGHSVRVDGNIVASDWPGESDHVAPQEVMLEAGRRYPIEVVAAQRGGRGDQSLVWTTPSMDGSDAVTAATGADLAVFVAGLSWRVEGEEMRVDADGFAGGDRTKIGLPAPQEELLKRIVATGTPTVLVLMNGSAMAVNWADANVPAILEAWYPGGEGGRVIAETLAGDRNPAGRLPVTFYRSADDLPPFGDYDMANRTYRYYSGEVLYPFGYGLSYSQFTYDNVAASRQTVDADGAVTISADVTNASTRDGDEVVQLYLSRGDMAGAPIRRLAGFQRIALKAGETRTVTFTLEGRGLSEVDAQGARRILPGVVDAWVGGGQPVERTGMTMAPGAHTRLTIAGERAFER